MALKRKKEEGAEQVLAQEAAPAPPAKGKAKAQESDVAAGQPAVTIGLVGHVDHGKTTLTEALSGKWTDTHSEEVKRGITIRLGYADVVVYKCPKCEGVEAFGVQKACAAHGPCLPVRKVSLVDAPGHESLMATMLSGATIMDGALLLIAANEVCPQPQTREHLMALQICGITHVIVVQNKIDLIAEDRVLRNHQSIKAFLKGTPYADAPIIPVSALHRVNIDALAAEIERTVPTPPRDPDAEPLMFIARSFDINKPGATPEQFQGGVLGGTVVRGQVRVGAKIELRPGRVVEEANQKVAHPLSATILGAMAGGRPVERVFPGGSIAVMTSLDPGVVKSDALVGNLVGLPGKLPQIHYGLRLRVTLLERVVGSQEELKVEPIKLNEVLMLNVNSAATVGFVKDLAKDAVECALKLPICAAIGSKVTISRRIGTRFRLIGYGLIEEMKKK